MGYAEQSRRSKFRLNGTLNFRISFDVNTARGLVLITKEVRIKVSLKKFWTNQNYDTAVFDQSPRQGKELFLASAIVGSYKIQLSYKTWRFTYVTDLHRPQPNLSWIWPLRRNPLGHPSEVTKHVGGLLSPQHLCACSEDLYIRQWINQQGEI